MDGAAIIMLKAKLIARLQIGMANSVASDVSYRQKSRTTRSAQDY